MPRSRTWGCSTTSATLLYSPDRKSTRLNSSHLVISYAVFCLKKKHIPRSSSNRSPALQLCPDRTSPKWTSSCPAQSFLPWSVDHKSRRSCRVLHCLQRRESLH